MLSLWMMITVLIGGLTTAGIETDGDDRYIVEGEYDNGQFDVGETVNVLGQDRDLRMLFTLNDIYLEQEGDGIFIVAEFRIENPNDEAIVPSEDFPMYFNLSDQVFDYAQTDIDYSEALAVGEVVYGRATLEYDTSLEGPQYTTVGFNMYPGGRTPEQDDNLPRPTVLELGDIRFTFDVAFLERRSY